MEREQKDEWRENDDTGVKETQREDRMLTGGGGGSRRPTEKQRAERER